MAFSQPDRKRIINTQELSDKLELMESTGEFSWEDCLFIWNDFVGKTNDLNRVAKSMNSLLQKIDGNIAHSIRSRVKDPDSLIRKIILCKSDRKLKYSAMTSKNYFMFVTDMIGCRVLTRYHHQWRLIHSELEKMFDRDNRKTIENDHIHNYVDNPRLVYFAEKPKAYYVNNDEKSSYYMKNETEILVEHSDLGYRGVHYIVKYKNQYIEIQVRTLFEEGWSECNHKYYKLPPCNKRKALKTPSSLLSSMAHQSDVLSQYIYSTLNDELPIRPAYCKPDDCIYDPARMEGESV